MRERERERERGINKVVNKILDFFFFLELSYSAILPLELHCSTIAKFFAIVDFYKSGCVRGLAFMLNFPYIWHMPFLI